MFALQKKSGPDFFLGNSLVRNGIGLGYTQYIIRKEGAAKYI